MFPFRLPAFSMIEILVVMVLSTLIVGVIYFSYSTIHSYETRLALQRESAEDIATLYYILKKDVQQSVVVRAPSKEAIICEFPRQKAVEYRFYEDHVLRQQLERVDTFLFNFQPGFYWSDRVLATFPAVVDEIRLSANDEKAELSTFAIRKYYDAATLIPLTEKDSLP